MVRFITCVAAVLCLSGAAWASSGFLDEASIEAVLSDQSHHGCYPDGSGWAETTTADGRIIDDLKGADVGTWRTDGASACYNYTNPETPAVIRGTDLCFAIKQDGRYLDYYFLPGGELAASTNCLKLTERPA